MTKSSVSQWDTTAANNTDIADIPLGENQMYPRDVNNAIRTMMAQIKTAVATGSTDNRLLRSDGTGGAALQSTGITVDDSNNVTGVGTFSSGAITSTGALDISGAAAGQVAFPASQNASAGANTLDDYEEGTFTPGMTINASATGITFTTQTGYYTKIGRQVTVAADVTLSSKGASAGSVLFTGLPFSVSFVAASAAFGSWSNLTTTTVVVGICSGTTILPIGSGTSATQLANTNLNNNSAFKFTGTYFN